MHSTLLGLVFPGRYARALESGDREGSAAVAIACMEEKRITWIVNGYVPCAVTIYGGFKGESHYITASEMV